MKAKTSSGNWGGTRPNSGPNPTTGHKTVNVRVPKPIDDEVIAYSFEHDVTKVEALWTLWGGKKRTLEEELPLTPIEIATLQNQVKQLESELSKRDTQLGELEQQLEQQQGEITALQAEKAAIQNEAQNMIDGLTSQSQTKVQELNAEVQRLVSEYDTLHKKYVALKKQPQQTEEKEKHEAVTIEGEATLVSEWEEIALNAEGERWKYLQNFIRVLKGEKVQPPKPRKK